MLYVSAYEPSDHDKEFAQIFSYKIEDIIADRGEGSRLTVVAVLKNFSAKFADQDPRFAYIVGEVATLIEEKLPTDANALVDQANDFVQEEQASDNAPFTNSNLEVVNSSSEASALLVITNVWQDEDDMGKINVKFMKHPDLNLSYDSYPHQEGRNV